ncbi:hypothetical protein HU723_25855 [Pseudomonas lurida]|uniref:hypothetical protein n=1 Tax=Pseudomonas lurida TaxID=244566 RepID=UPI00164789A9|nr:hypothetical protein [Pseudomonas lurida]MBC3242616.1 hypothetical protein [Pseudomonas lurida]
MASQQQKLESETETLLLELEDRKAELKLDQLELKTLEVQYQNQEDEIEQLEDHIIRPNKLMHGETSLLDEALRQQHLYGRQITRPPYPHSNFAFCI